MLVPRIHGQINSKDRSLERTISRAGMEGTSDWGEASWTGSRSSSHCRKAQSWEGPCEANAALVSLLILVRTIGLVATPAGC